MLRGELPPAADPSWTIHQSGNNQISWQQLTSIGCSFLPISGRDNQRLLPICKQATSAGGQKVPLDQIAPFCILQAAASAQACLSGCFYSKREFCIIAEESGIAEDSSTFNARNPNKCSCRRAAGHRNDRCPASAAKKAREAAPTASAKSMSPQRLLEQQLPYHLMTSK